MTSKIILDDGVTELSGIRSVTYTETVNSGTDLRPGCVGSACISVDMFGTQANAIPAGSKLYYYQVNDGVSTLIGQFYAEPSITTKQTYRFVAYDIVSKLDVDFSTWLSSHQEDFPMTIYSLVSAACSVAGVTLGSASWPLSTQSVNAFYADNLTCRNILEYAAEIACRFVRTNTSNQIVFDWYTTNNSKSIRPGATQSGYIAYKQDGLNYENYTTETLDRVAIYPGGSDNAAFIYPTDASTGNTLSINGNLLLTDALDTTYIATAQNIYTTLSALGTYRPMSANLFPGENPFRAGEKVTVVDSQNVSFTTLIMNMTVTPSEATLSSTGSETYNGYGENPVRTIANLSSNVVQIDNLMANKADVDMLNVSGTAIANRIDVDTLMARDIKATGVFQVDNGVWLLVQNSDGLDLETAAGVNGVPYGFLRVAEHWARLLTRDSLGQNTGIIIDGDDNDQMVKIECASGGGLIMDDNGTEIRDIKSLGDIIPTQDSSYKIGSTSKKWTNIYTDAVNLNGSDLGNTIDALNVKMLGVRGQIGALSSWNIDDMASNETYGTWWLNVADSDITGTKPTSSGHGLLFCTRQSSGISRQYYRGVTVRGDYHRYYTHSTGVWTAWEPVPGIPLIDSFTGTTSANGNFSHTFSKNVVVLSSWSSSSDKIVSAYPSGGTTTGGATTWWFHVRNANANGTVVASTSTTVTVSYMYV